ncbi:MAG: histidine phosphatase family protein [Paracoccaceae bacterium]
MPIYLIRHGQSEFNAAFRAGEPDPMIFDAPLTELGVAQAKAARVAVQKLGIQTVIASPLTRALQTAQHIFGETHDINVRAGPHELLTHSCDVGRSMQQLQGEFPQLSFDHVADLWWHQGAPNQFGYCVEPQGIFARRVHAFVATLTDFTDRPIAVVGHGNTFRELVGYDMENCEIARFPLGEFVQQPG